MDTGALLALDQPSKALLMQGRLDERHHAVVTSDPDDIARIDPSLPLIRV